MNGIQTKLYEFGPRAIMALVLFASMWATGIALQLLFEFLGRRAKVRKDVVSLSGRLLHAAGFMFGLVTALGTLGVNVSALVAGLGLTGFAVGFALKDALSNVLSGVIVLIYRPFCVGDRIQVTGFEGEVTEIDLRYTTLETTERKILIPNANLFTNPVVILRPPPSS